MGESNTVVSADTCIGTYNSIALTYRNVDSEKLTCSKNNIGLHAP